nr:MAG TPA: hypothetical protein [Caudoviricetes sp.]
MQALMKLLIQCGKRTGICRTASRRENCFTAGR